MRIRMDAAGLIASIVVACGGLDFPGGSPLSWVGVFSISARASEAIVARADTCSWNYVDWEEMSEDERTAWQTLGWTASLWGLDDPATQPASSQKDWRELSKNQRSAALRLGYRQNTWDHEKCKKP